MGWVSEERITKGRVKQCAGVRLGESGSRSRDEGGECRHCGERDSRQVTTAGIGILLTSASRKKAEETRGTASNSGW